MFIDIRDAVPLQQIYGELLFYIGYPFVVVDAKGSPAEYTILRLG